MLLCHHMRRPPCSIPLALLSVGLLLGVWLAVSFAQVSTAIRPDGTLGTTVTQTDNLYDITGGMRPGNGPNLFHSFDRFSVGTNDTARFSGPSGIKNILSRVTGGQQSLIDGQLQSTIPGANLYLLNPSGVLFGSNASLDISGSFHVSTADYLRFADGVTFSARLGETTTLTVSPPVAFGFLSPQPAPITIQGSTLQVSEGKALSVVGGDMQIVRGQLVVPSGRVQLASVASPGEVTFSPLELEPVLRVDAFTRLGQLELSQGALLNASGNGGGTVLLRSGRLRVDGSAMLASNTGPLAGTGLGLDLQIAEDAVLTNRALLATDSLGVGQARDLRITAGSLHLDNAAIGSRPFASGNGGNVTLNMGQLTLTGGAQLDNSTRDSGHSGTMTVAATEAISISGQGSGLFSNTFSLGDAGQLVISAPALTMDSGLIQASAVLGSRGNAGGIDVRVGRLTLTGGAQLDSSTRGSGRGGTVTVAATDMISIAGRDQEGNLSGLFSLTTGSGDAGNLDVRVGQLTLTDGAQISSSTQGGGHGGTVTVAATEAISISGQGSGLFSLTTGSGDAGNLDVRVGRLTLTGGAQISSSTRGSGHGGTVTIAAAEQLDLSNGGTISARSTGQGNAGNIVIQTGKLFRSHNGAVTTEAETADGGNITLTAGSLVELRDSQITATVKGGAGKGGNITIDSQFVVSQRSQIRADAFGGPGGNVRLVAEVFLTDPESRVSASSARGIQGTVDIRALVTNLSGVVTPLAPDFARATALLRDRCAARLREGTVSSFVVRGRASVPTTYDGLLPSRLYAPQGQRTLPIGADQPPVEPPGTPQERRRANPAGRVQETSGLVFPVPPLLLSCAH